MTTYDCTICLEPVSMKEDKAANRVWDTDVEPGGWCHRRCRERTPEEALLADIFGDSVIATRRRIAGERVAATGRLIVRRPEQS